MQISQAQPSASAYTLGAEDSILTLAHILIDLDKRGAVDPDMKQAILRSSNGLISMIPRMIQCASQALASAHSGDGGLDSAETAQASWAIGLMANTLEGALQLKEWVSTPDLHP
jgi:hypothetical protein